MAIRCAQLQVNYPTSCSEPERLSGKPWADVEQREFACKPEIRYSDIQVPT